MATATGQMLSVRRIVITGVLAAIAILLGVTRLGFIAVPNISGNATIMHVPAIIGGVLEGPLVGFLIGTIFGLYSFLQATSPLFKNPIIAFVPRMLIGVTAALTYFSLRRSGNEILALAMAGVVGTLTNTVLVLGLAVAFGLLPVAAIAGIIPQAVAELVIAAVITVAVVAAWKRIDTGRGRSSI